MATPPGDGGNVPREGFYPDPSIPGYIRYWNGAAWVPGTSRPAPREGESVPALPAAAPAPAPVPPPAPPAVDETGPVFLDDGSGGRPAQEPASAWRADASRQSGLGGARDARVSWGATPGQDPRIPAPSPAPPAAADGGEGPGAPAPDPTGGALPGVRALGPGPSATGTEPGGAPGGDGTGAGGGNGIDVDHDSPVTDGTVAIRPLRRNKPPTPRESGPPADSTMTIRALRAARRAKDEEAASGRTGRDEGTMAIRAVGAGPRPQLPARQPGQQQPQDRTASPAPAVPAQPQPYAPVPAPAPEPAPGPEPGPVSAGSGGGATSWAQQVHRLAQADPGDQPVVPWKPPVEDPFLQAARAQAAARPAGLGKRVVARLIDTLVLGLVVGAAAVPLISGALAHIDTKVEAARQTGETVTVWLLDATTAGYFGGVLATLLVVGVLYEAVPTAKWGATLGKKLCGLDVRDIETHEPPAFGAALRRWLVYSVLGVLVVGIANVLWCLIDRPWRQCWHDKAAHTFVAR
ncbi:RDD family protein [Streptomyces sp. NPDC093085]|uniref:RDD family protein n=1 Tax=Streptomyces sp. NPDC093085 TaxID=3155068 RepID=UPI00341F2E82